MLLKDVDEAALERGLATIRKNYDVVGREGQHDAPRRSRRTMALITPTTSYDGFDPVDIVVEAVFENMELKKKTFAELGTVTRAGLRARVEHLDARHRRVRAGERPAGAGASAITSSARRT